MTLANELKATFGTIQYFYNCPVKVIETSKQ